MRSPEPAHHHVFQCVSAAHCAGQPPGPVHGSVHPYPAGRTTVIRQRSHTRRWSLLPFETSPISVSVPETAGIRAAPDLQRSSQVPEVHSGLVLRRPALTVPGRPSVLPGITDREKSVYQSFIFPFDKRCMTFSISCEENAESLI
ncbi:hypothetical protein VA7868_04391 [Vibrio aerogenes CECT 7868]|uniref:Uncharacterized protein n=1 Tax=Vibrio aerogenes CECT 7868 TaxID=1216006 RepID=A0A1M6E6S1_9VIBR|nr:hypothetical protein VA7868_04391 [Vibrio aerogenes CECT 7868]